MAQQAAKAPAVDAYYPGKDLGLPRTGSASVASMLRRFLALLADWLLCLLIVTGLTHPHYWTTVHGQARLTSAYWTAQYRTMLLFVVEVYVLTALGGMTIGQRLFSIRVIRPGGGRIGFRWAALRTLLILTVVPPLLTDKDLRGMHDRATDTVVVRL